MKIAYLSDILFSVSSWSSNSQPGFSPTGKSIGIRCMRLNALRSDHNCSANSCLSLLSKGARLYRHHSIFRIIQSEIRIFKLSLVYILSRGCWATSMTSRVRELLHNSPLMSSYLSSSREGRPYLQACRKIKVASCRHPVSSSLGLCREHTWKCQSTHRSP